MPLEEHVNWACTSKNQDFEEDKKMKRVGILVLTLTMLVLAVTPAFAKGPPGFGFLYYDGDVVRTVVPPAAMPKEGTDPLYPIEGGAEGQLPVAGVAPGDRGYHGGKWAVNVVTWNVTPYLLTSESEWSRFQVPHPALTLS
jgi:hypothetical protein